MSEEEILKECTELAENKNHELGDCWDEEYSSNAIFGLIMLYKQSKKEIGDLQALNKETEKERDNIYLDYQDLGKENLKLQEELEKYKTYYEEMEEVNKKFIAVEKIKEKIEEENRRAKVRR